MLKRDLLCWCPPPTSFFFPDLEFAVIWRISMWTTEESWLCSFKLLPQETPWEWCDWDEDHISDVGTCTRWGLDVFPVAWWNVCGVAWMWSNRFSYQTSQTKIVSKCRSHEFWRSRCSSLSTLLKCLNFANDPIGSIWNKFNMAFPRLAQTQTRIGILGSRGIVRTVWTKRTSLKPTYSVLKLHQLLWSYVIFIINKLPDMKCAILINWLFPWLRKRIRLTMSVSK